MTKTLTTITTIINDVLARLAIVNLPINTIVIRRITETAKVTQNTANVANVVIITETPIVKITGEPKKKISIYHVRLKIVKFLLVVEIRTASQLMRILSSTTTKPLPITAITIKKELIITSNSKIIYKHLVSVVIVRNQLIINE